MITSLFPLLAVFTVVSALSQAGYRLLDPRPKPLAQRPRGSRESVRWQRIRMPAISLPSLASVSVGILVVSGFLLR